MKTLTILRHAKSSWKQQGMPDRQRPLSRRGEREAPVMGSRISEAGIRPSLIMSSPATRAWKTARMVARTISYPLEFLHREQDMYLADAERLLDLLSRQDSAFNSILMVGHNPGLSDFANFLSPRSVESLPTCGVIALRIETVDWDLRAGKPAEVILQDAPGNHRGDND